jgi:pyruvate carboxylase
MMLKASWGGGGLGMRAIRDPKDLTREVSEAKREAKAAFGKDEERAARLALRRGRDNLQLIRFCRKRSQFFN